MDVGSSWERHQNMNEFLIALFLAGGRVLEIILLRILFVYYSYSELYGRMA